jgi:serpin B
MAMGMGKITVGVVMLSSLFGSKIIAGVAQPASVVEGNTAFALDIYARLKKTLGNLFFSPYSISTALAMTYAGARGDTEKQMGKVFRFDTNQNKLHAGFGQLQNQLNEYSKQKGIELTIANALWTQQDHPFIPRFLKTAKENYHANLNQIDFKTGAEVARNEINRWVAQNTKDKIQNILPPGSLHALTRLVLANAIYFKGAWTEPFNKASTAPQPFHLSSVSKVEVPLMHHFDNVAYLENSDFQAVQLPYSTGELAMVILLPRQVDGCRNLEERLTPSLLSHSLRQMKQQRVEIFLPRFKLESGFDLVQTLASMGMPDAFGQKADLSGIDGSRELFISGIFHKAWGEVNEEGTEAAAATAVAVAGRAISKPPPPPPVFRADHPFIFLIRDTRSGSLLFLGRFMNPSQ